jgi:hypothetical protein
MRIRHLVGLIGLIPAVALAQTHRYVPTFPSPPNNMSVTTPQRGYPSPIARQVYSTVGSAVSMAGANSVVRAGGQVITRYGYGPTGMYVESFRIDPVTGAAVMLLTPNTAR